MDRGGPEDGYPPGRAPLRQEADHRAGRAHLLFLVQRSPGVPGQFLIRLRLVSEEQLFKALLAQEEKGRLLGSILVSDGILSEEDLRQALKAKAEETIYDLFLWPRGAFEFKEGDFPQDVLIAFETAVTPVIMEGIRRVDEWQRIRAVFPTMETTFKLQGVPQTIQ